jgi:hypothetical protein
MAASNPSIDLAQRVLRLRRVAYVTLAAASLPLMAWLRTPKAVVLFAIIAVGSALSVRRSGLRTALMSDVTLREVGISAPRKEEDVEPVVGRGPSGPPLMGPNDLHQLVGAEEVRDCQTKSPVYGGGHRDVRQVEIADLRCRSDTSLG